MDLARLRLSSQHLLPSGTAALEDEVARFGGMQGQDLPGVKWSVGLRCAGATETDVDRAFLEGRVVRTWPMRGTLHLVAAADARWLIALFQAGNLKRAAYRQKQLGLSEKDVARALTLFERALRDGRQRTREELAQVLARGKVSPAGQRTYHLLWQGAVRGLLVSGAPRDGEPTFALLDEWVPRSRSRAPAAPAAELALRYFTSHGPATLKDFTWWSSLSAPQAREALEAVKPQLVRDGDGWRAGEVGPAPSRSALALPGFDEYLLGYQDRSAVLEPRFAERVCPGGNGVFQPTLVLDGRVVGTWRRQVKGDAVAFELLPFKKLSAADRARCDEALDVYARFRGRRSRR